MIDNIHQFMFLFSYHHGLCVFIVSIICYIIYTQYLYLFPHFQLPFNIPIRSRFGYAFTGELEELQRIKEPLVQQTKQEFWDQGYGFFFLNPAMLALSNNQHHVVQWLEKEKGAQKHIDLFNERFIQRRNSTSVEFKAMNADFARDTIGVEYFHNV